MGITLQGTVSFISKGWGGRTSDKYVTENCDFLNCIMPGDVILPDHGFNMAGTIGLYKGELKIPAFTKGKKQLDPVDLENTRCLASVKIHVERVTGNIRKKRTVLNTTALHKIIRKGR